MNWKFWDRKPKYEVEVKEVSLPTLIRWYLYDTDVVSPNDLAVKLGLVPTSPDVESKEQDASKIRTERVEPYMTFLQAMADLNASVMVAINKDVAREHNPDLTDKDALLLETTMRSLYGAISFAAIYSSFSAALELGVIENPGTLSTSGRDNDGEF